MSPLPSRCSAPITSSTVRESTRVATRKLMRDGKFALIKPVITSTLGRCVASTRCMPTARAICARRVTLLPRWRAPASSGRPTRRSRIRMYGSGFRSSSATALFFFEQAARLVLQLPALCDCTDRCCGRPARPAASAAAPFRAPHCAARWWPSSRSVITGVSRCGMPSYKPNSRRFGSTMIMRTSSGVALYRIDMISELSITLLPDPVDPAISRCGMDSSAATLMRPLMSLPRQMVRARGGIAELFRFQNLAQADHLAARDSEPRFRPSACRECARSESIRPAGPGTDLRSAW